MESAPYGRQIPDFSVPHTDSDNNLVSVAVRIFTEKYIGRPDRDRARHRKNPCAGSPVRLFAGHSAGALIPERSVTQYDSQKGGVSV